jgi:capsule polysaccharide modification protein KpsS
MIVYDQFPGKIAISSSQKLIWNGVEEEVEKLSSTSPAKESEILSATSFLEDYRKELPAPNTFSKKKLPRIRSQDFILWINWVRDYFSDKNSILKKSPLSMIFTKFRRIMRGIISRWIFLDFNKSAIGDYIFFPLHFQPEMTTLVCAPYYINQVSIIEDIAKSLPVGVRLVVKEHHGSVGRRKLSDYLDIKKNWNVVLVAPHENTMEIIKNSKTVITINSTVGLEGLLLGKPVIAFLINHHFSGIYFAH